MLGLRPPGLEFQVLCLEGSVISVISPSSRGSLDPAEPLCAHRWSKTRFISFLPLGETEVFAECQTGVLTQVEIINLTASPTFWHHDYLEVISCQIIYCWQTENASPPKRKANAGPIVCDYLFYSSCIA